MKELLGSLELNRIYQFDCVEGMKLLPDNSIDLTVTSPPYDNLRNYKGFTFDFESIAKELFRVTKPGGIVVWVVGDATIKGTETGTSFKQALYFKEIGFNIHDTMIYAKENPVPQADKSRYTQSFEYMFVFSKDKPKTVNRLEEPCINAGKKKISTNNNPESSDRNRVHITKDTKPLKNIWNYKVGTNLTTKDKIAFQHPAIFPEKLAEDHILTWSNEGDIVLDVFTGAATTPKMAILNNRKWLGFEISPEYIEIANKRLDNLELK